jgi:hypothetical protein
MIKPFRICLVSYEARRRCVGGAGAQLRLAKSEEARRRHDFRSRPDPRRHERAPKHFLRFKVDEFLTGSRTHYPIPSRLMQKILTASRNFVKPTSLISLVTDEVRLLAQLSRSAYVRNLAHRFRSFMAIDRKVSALIRRKSAKGVRRALISWVAPGLPPFLQHWLNGTPISSSGFGTEPLGSAVEIRRSMLFCVGHEPF